MKVNGSLTLCGVDDFVDHLRELLVPCVDTNPESGLRQIAMSDTTITSERIILTLRYMESCSSIGCRPNQ